MEFLPSVSLFSLLGVHCFTAQYHLQSCEAVWPCVAWPGKYVANILILPCISSHRVGLCLTGFGNACAVCILRVLESGAAAEAIRFIGPARLEQLYDGSENVSDAAFLQMVIKERQLGMLQHYRHLQNISLRPFSEHEGQSAADLAG